MLLLWGLATAASVVINEVDYDQSGADTLEFIEILNAGEGEADLTAMRIEVQAYNRRQVVHALASGTVDYVGPNDHDFIHDIEAREKAGTPGILQTLRAALAFDVKTAVGIERIEQREAAMLRDAFARWDAHPQIEILGNPDPARRVGIVSFNIKDPKGQYLHPRLITTLLNDLFGIQSRAGCSCAGPYGHQLLGIDEHKAQDFRTWINRGYHGVKPGWCRVGFHYVFDDAEVEYLIGAVEFLAEHGHRFVPQYQFDAKSGRWQHKQWQTPSATFSISEALQSTPIRARALPEEARRQRYKNYLEQALRLAEAAGD